MRSARFQFGCQSLAFFAILKSVCKSGVSSQKNADWRRAESYHSELVSESLVKIATHLDTIQSAIDNKKQQLSLLNEAVKSKSLVKQQIADLQELLDSKMQQYFA